MGRNHFLSIVMMLVLVATFAIVALSIVQASQERAEPAGPSEPVAPEPVPDDEAEPEPAEVEVTLAEDEPEPVEPRIVRVEMDGQDLADLLNVRAWKFDYQLPEDEQYTAQVWLEQWTQDAPQPDVWLLLNQTLTADTGSMLVRLPTTEEEALFVRVGAAVVRAADAEIDMPTPIRRDVLEERAINYDEEINLLSFTHNADAPTAGGLVDVHKDHDYTLYVKVRFFRGTNVPFQEEYLGR
ncbi:MAG: hypothetical protein WD294_12380 [Phycisphaeraceae bacterium]